MDSGSTHCFIDSTFVSKHQLQTLSITLIPLQLFDGTTNTIIHNTVDLPIRFTSGEIQHTTFYITLLDVSCSAVLGHSWLTRYNPLIDWVLGSILFRPPKETESLAPPVLATPASGTPNSMTNISLIGAAAFAWASRLADMQVFKLFVSTIDPRDLDTTLVDMSNVPLEYHKFCDVFSKSHANTLPSHQPYDLKIKLEDGAIPPFGPIYSLSPHELQMLREFIDEHLANGLIRPTRSLSGALVLFVKKKDGSLQLCIDFRGLNKIMKKDRYLLPRITDLLDSPRKARFYSKIDLRHAYHLIQIQEGDEWKTTFRTCYGSLNGVSCLSDLPMPPLLSSAS